MRTVQNPLRMRRKNRRRKRRDGQSPASPESCRKRPEFTPRREQTFRPDENTVQSFSRDRFAVMTEFQRESDCFAAAEHAGRAVRSQHNFCARSGCGNDLPFRAERVIFGLLIDAERMKLHVQASCVFRKFRLRVMPSSTSSGSSYSIIAGPSNSLSVSMRRFQSRRPSPHAAGRTPPSTSRKSLR